MASLITAREFERRPDPGHPEELVRGRIVAIPPHDLRHGLACGRASFALYDFVIPRDLGHVIGGGSAILTERDPDTVRGADVAYYSYARLPKGPLVPGYGPEVPELVVEVRSTHDSWREILVKVTEYLSAGVLKVIVLDPEKRKAHIYTTDEEPTTLGPDDDLTLPGLLDGFCVPVHRFFE